MSTPGLVVDIGEVVLPDVAGAHPAIVRRLIEARVRGALMEAGAMHVPAMEANAGAIATQVAAAVLQLMNARGGRAHGS
jgi:hypothetical protein